MICWIASYPKSGNTWIRTFLANWFADKEEPLSFNDFREYGLSWQDTTKLVWADYPFPAEIQHRVRPIAIKRLAREAGSGITFMKTHTGHYEIEGYHLLPVEATWGAIYVVRNPIDLCPSFARHMGTDLDVAVTAMNDRGRYLINHGVVQHLGRWCDHAFSFLQDGFFVVRYEDLKTDPEQCFGSMLDYLSLPRDERLHKAIEFSSLDVMKKQEEENEFNEGNGQKFFGQTTEKLDAAQKTIVCQNHGEVMREFGYL